MDQVHPTRIRTVALVGHSGVGKTTLAEALLHRAGATTRRGTVEDGTTVCDTEPEEIRRGISIGLAVAPFTWTADDGEAYEVTLLDTPGYADFAGAVDAALSVADLALVVVSAVDGVQVGTRAVWDLCAARGIPRMLFVTKEDKPRACFARVLAELRAELGPHVVPLELPVGEEGDLHGIADVLSDQNLTYHSDGTHHTDPMPPGLAAQEQALHDQVTEEIVAGDDEQLERYLAGELPSVADLGRALAHEVLTCSAFPVLLGSATTGVGVDRLADLVCELGPGPRPVTVELAGHPDGPLTVTPDPDAEPLAHVFRTVADPYVGQVSLLKVISGTLREDDRLVNTTTGVEERLHGLFRLRGTTHLPTSAVTTGQVAAVPKLSATPTGSLLAPRGHGVRMPLTPPRPHVYATALVPLTQADDDKLSGALARLCAEDPTLCVERLAAPAGAGHAQTVLRGLGDVHLAVALERLERKLGVRVRTEPVQVAYRETIAAAADVEGKVKKQSGGHGQFAVVRLRVRPLTRGEGLVFRSTVVGGSVPRSYLPSVERGIREAMADGGPRGYPVVDLEVECHDGRAHAVDSSDMAFRNAAAHGLRQALAHAGTVVLEPVDEVAVVVPSELQGEVLGDLSARRGRITGSDVLPDGSCRIAAHVPRAELTRYLLDLRSLTGGRGTFTSRYSHDDVVPGHLVHRVGADAG
ncbi:elongation factor G [Cellulomonas bogoriensis]|uniref:GTP-binding protein n=1 Tax=Cellulomonas bogoriensis 69B4 = DSM 16987 TaxID=1386082 RepID=A0A0A0C031_9CELL|nr:elongation factor G [Cellulomonas bogoriensis]KGM13556.1 GTP-binding protein [Cellulomonas bogoriensis 69B4 = DSM 16987]